MSELMWDRGRTGVLAHKDQFNRREKDLLRSDPNVMQCGAFFFFPIQEEPDDEVEALALAAYEEFQENEQKSAPEQGDEPTMADLRALKVDDLRALADKEQVDLTGLKLKDDILGRMAYHFGLDPAN